MAQNPNDNMSKQEISENAEVRNKSRFSIIIYGS
jgi:hypothetical protein